MTTCIKHICVLIPARNEEYLLPRCLQSILVASSNLNTSVSVDVILCVDSSQDRTLEIGQKILNQKGIVVSVLQRNVGFARKFAAQIALERYSGPLDECWIANTDADCEVPENWISKQILWANKGLQGVTGIVKVDSYHEHQSHVSEQFLKDYTIHTDGTHPHVHGANLGIRADVYQKVGGWHSLKTAEDHDLWNRLTDLRIPKIADANLYVVTSGRRLGRAPHGFAGRLASYNGIK